MVMLEKDNYTITPGAIIDIYWSLNNGVVTLNLLNEDDNGNFKPVFEIGSKCFLIP
jgi:hypothetical protein